MFSNTRTSWAYALVASLALRSAVAQVTTDCNALEKDCPAKPAFGMEHFFNFNATPPTGTWTSSAGEVTYDPNLGAVFTIDKQGISPTLSTDFYFFWGRTEMMMRVAPGTGIISSMMWLSDVLDEVDWEFFGTNTTAAATNYFGKGEPDFKNGAYFNVDGAAVQDDFHNYTTVWTKEKLEWWIDGNLVRTLLPGEAEGGNKYPQTPMKLSLGIWAGGDPRMPEGTREWAGGDTNFDEGPFTMYVKSIKVEDYTKDAKEYSYGDRSGSWESIKVTSGNSTAKEAIFKKPETPEPTISEKFEKLPENSKTAIYASAGGVGALIVAAGLWFCIRQRRRGAREAKIAEQEAAKEQQDLARYEKAGINPDSFANQQNDYRVAEVSEDGTVTEKAPNVFASPFDSRPNTTETGHQNQQQWPLDPQTPGTPGGAAAAAMRSPVPLLQDGASSPRVGSPGPNGGRPYLPGQSPYGMQPEPMRSQSPAHTMGNIAAGGAAAAAAAGGMRPRYAPNSPPSPHSPHSQRSGHGPNSPHGPYGPNRSASGPNAYMRTQSPGMQQGQGFGAPPPSQSPAGYMQQGQGFGGPLRSQSPAHMQPPRSASAAPRPNQGYAHPGGPDAYWNNNNNNNNNNNGPYR